MHRDYQGSIVAITNDTGAVLEKRQFDAWGAILKVQDGANNVLNGLTILDRGYTGHEHLQSVGLINMNGRLYDPKLHRFLQPDNYVQDIENTQNYNRYSYVLNNPLKYTDPSGEAGTNPNETYPSWYNDGTVKYGVSIDAAGWERLKADFNRFAGHVGDWSRDGWNGVKNGFKEVGNWVGGWFKKGSSGPPPYMATNVNMNPYTPSGSNSFGQGGFGNGLSDGFGAGVGSTLGFFKSLGKAEGWQALGQGVIDTGYLACSICPQGMVMRSQMADATIDYVDNIPNMSAYEMGYDIGFSSEKALEIAATRRLALSFKIYPNAKGFGFDFGKIRFDAHRFRLGGRKTGYDVWLPHIDVPSRGIKHWPWHQIDKFKRGVK